MHPRRLTTRFGDEELHHAVCLRVLACKSSPGGHVAKVTRFANEVLTEVVSTDDVGREASHRAHTEALAMYGRQLKPLLAHNIDSLILAGQSAHLQSACNEIVSLISDGLPVEDSRCSEEEGIACLVQCGCDAETPLRQAFVGFLLCLFAEMWSFSESNLALVVCHGGLPLITAALATDSSMCSFQKLALAFLEKAVDPGNCYDVREDVAKYAAVSTDLIPSLVEAVRVEQDKAIAVLSGLVHVDRNLLTQVTGRTVHDLILWDLLTARDS